ncbi:carbon monoxide-induced hydrogenase, CooL subunit [Thermofilum adornatum 1505]|uniref:Carbon monoxide-induced hydrogenase, CooL subunit n=1 Tax=Thermofilum adornatum 1505 TaxID=697581 RepID=A0A3G1A8S1_9CREN|nr:carbon monoxide-induced hydrogenase, CooL subunit [Thermofilum adornatum 1505]
MIKYVKRKILKRSIWVFHLNTGACNGCDIEIIATLTPKFDAERFGVKLVGSPRHADVLLVTGPVTQQTLPRVMRVYEMVPEPKAVVAVGTCACDGGVFKDGETFRGPLSRIMPVDVFVYGCPPRPQNILKGILEAANIYSSKSKGVKK